MITYRELGAQLVQEMGDEQLAQDVYAKDMTTGEVRLVRSLSDHGDQLVILVSGPLDDGPDDDDQESDDTGQQFGKGTDD